MNGRSGAQSHNMIVKGESTIEPISRMVESLQAVCAALAGDGVVKIKSYCRHFSEIHTQFFCCLILKKSDQS